MYCIKYIEIPERISLWFPVTILCQEPLLPPLRSAGCTRPCFHRSVMYSPRNGDSPENNLFWWAARLYISSTLALMEHYWTTVNTANSSFLMTHFLDMCRRQRKLRHRVNATSSMDFTPTNRCGTLNPIITSLLTRSGSKFFLSTISSNKEGFHESRSKDKYRGYLFLPCANMHILVINEYKTYLRWVEVTNPWEENDLCNENATGAELWQPWQGQL